MRSYLPTCVSAAEFPDCDGSVWWRYCRVAELVWGLHEKRVMDDSFTVLQMDLVRRCQVFSVCPQTLDAFPSRMR